MNGLPYTVCLWGSHPDAGNDDCHTGDDFATLDEARAAFEAWDTHFAAGSVLSTTHVELDGPDVHEVKQVRAKRADDYIDAHWRHEMAMEAGMGLGIDAYNEVMGYD